MSDELETQTVSFLQETQQRYEEIRASYTYHEAQCRRLMARMNEMIPAIWALEAEQKKQIRAVDDGEAMRKADTDASRQPISALTPQREDEVLLADQQDTPPQSNAQASETDAAALDDMTQEQYYAAIEQETGHSVSCSTFDPEIGVCDCVPNTEQVSFAEDDDSDDGFDLGAEVYHWEPSEQIWMVGGGSYTTERIPTPKASEAASELETQAKVGDDRVALHDQPALSDEAFNALPKLDDTAVIDAEPPTIPRSEIPEGVAVETFTEQGVETVKIGGLTHIVEGEAPVDKFSAIRDGGDAGFWAAARGLTKIEEMA